MGNIDGFGQYKLGGGSGDGKTLVETVRNTSGSTIEKGQPLHITGVNGTTPTVEVANASDINKMPVSGLAKEQIPNNTDGQMIISGILDEIDTQSIVGFPVEGEIIYVNTSTGGSIDFLTSDQPTSQANLIQNIGIVIKSGPSSSGSLQVTAIGRTNATPNLDENNIFLGNASNQSEATAPSISTVGKIADEGNQVQGDFLQFQDDGSGNTVLSTQATSFNYEKTVCVIIPTSTSYPDSAINWFYQSSSFAKWFPTSLDPVFRKKDMLGLKDMNVRIFVSAMSDNNNQVAWELKLFDKTNFSNSINLLTSSDVGSSNIITIGGTYGNFGVGWTAYSKDFTVALGNDLDTIFFSNFNTTEAQVELHIANNGSQGSIITGCTTRFLSL